MLNRLWEHRKIRFLCVGTMNAIVDLSILNVLVFKFDYPVWLANTIAVSAAITFSYFMNHKLVFRHHHHPNPKQFMKFFLITGVGIIVTQTFVIYITIATVDSILHGIFPALSSDIVDKLSLNISKVSAALIGIAWNYLFYSRVVFRKSPDYSEIKDITETV